jgi:hypothetical protein
VVWSGVGKTPLAYARHHNRRPIVDRKSFAAPLAALIDQSWEPPKPPSFS